jgi:hypothetical protein
MFCPEEHGQSCLRFHATLTSKMAMRGVGNPLLDPAYSSSQVRRIRQWITNTLVTSDIAVLSTMAMRTWLELVAMHSVQLGDWIWCEQQLTTCCMIRNIHT